MKNRILKFSAVLFMMFAIISSFTINIYSAPIPKKVNKDFLGNCSDVIKLDNINNGDIIATNDLVVLNGVGKENAQVAIYELDDDNYIIYKDYDNDTYSWKIGVAGVFAKQVSLRDGVNKLLIFAQRGKDKQAIRLDVKIKDNKVSKFLQKDVISFSDLLNLK